jgi:antitoxin VapB
VVLFSITKNIYSIKYSALFNIILFLRIVGKYFWSCVIDGLLPFILDEPDVRSIRNSFELAQTKIMYIIYNIIYIQYIKRAIIMALSIRNQHAEKLARDVAATAGESITQAIIHALEERLARLQGRRSAPDTLQEIMTIGRRCSDLPDQDPRTADEILGYDDTGAP